jgi:hypothetical protein
MIHTHVFHRRLRVYNRLPQTAATNSTANQIGLPSVPGQRITLPQGRVRVWERLDRPEQLSFIH